MIQFDPDLIAIALAINPDVGPEELLANTDLFLNQVMARAELKDAVVAQHHYTIEQFQVAYENAPADLYFPPSWEFWCMKLYGASDYKPPPPSYPKSPASPPCEYPPELISASHRVNWYTKPEKLLANTDLFLNHVMARGRPEAIQAALNHYTIEQFQSAYEFAPPGEYGPVTWAYWGLMLFGNTKHKPNLSVFPDTTPLLGIGPCRSWSKLSA